MYGTLFIILDINKKNKFLLTINLQIIFIFLSHSFSYGAANNFFPGNSILMGWFPQSTFFNHLFVFQFLKFVIVLLVFLLLYCFLPFRLRFLNMFRFEFRPMIDSALSLLSVSLFKRLFEFCLRTLILSGFVIPSCIKKSSYLKVTYFYIKSSNQLKTYLW